MGDPGDVVYFGRTDFRNTNRLFGIKRRDRRQHTYVVGKTGTGKSALLKNMALQDIVNGDGVCVVDPHGEFVEELITMIPQSRVKDVVYFNPADADFHLGFNVLELPDPQYKHLVASGLMAIFTKIWAGVWSARMEYIMNNAILALLDTPGTTLLGVNRILVDKEYRQKILANIKDPVVKAFWVNEYEEWKDQFRNEAIAPIQNKVGQFLSTGLIRNVVGQVKSTIRIDEIMNDRKIFLVNVAKGRIGEDNSALLGAMLITKLQLTAMERVRIPESERADFFLYVDEFQNFATDSFAGILSEARKYRLNLTLAHQYIGQLILNDSTMVRDAVFGNVGTMIMFRIGASDAEFLENEFTPEFVIQDMVNLPNYCIYLKLMVDGMTSRPFSAATLPPFKISETQATREEVIKSSRERYARPRAIVEGEISRWASGGMDLGSDVSGKSSDDHAPYVQRAQSPRTEGAGVRYAAICDSCKKETELNFVPTPGRAIYCRECLAKVKAGELPRAKVLKPPREGRDSFDDLASMGIEYEKRDAPPQNHSQPHNTKPAGLDALVRSGVAEPVDDVVKTSEMPLEALTKNHEKPKNQHQPKPADINALKHAIQKALKNGHPVRPVVETFDYNNGEDLGGQLEEEHTV